MGLPTTFIYIYLEENIMKKILALAAAAALAGGLSAMAANPFTDVTTDDWAYQAVAELSDQGVVEGYPDGTFRGERNMTRFELAQIIARLMAREDQLNAEQRATLDKLAGEYADELANLGVRVSNLEKRVGNISWNGDAKMWYVNNANKAKSDTWKGRMRIKVRGQVNDSTYVQGRLNTTMFFKDPKASDGQTTMDWLYVNHSSGDVNVTAGRIPVTIYDGFMYDYQLKGAILSYNKDAFHASASYGRFLSNENIMDTSKYDAFLGQAGVNMGFASVDAAYLKFTGDQAKKDLSFDNMWSAHVAIPMNDFKVFGEYWKSNADKADQSWQAGLGYTGFNGKKPGTFSLAAAYNEVGRNANIDGTTYDVQDFWGAIQKNKTIKYWSVFGDVALQKNVSLHGEYVFDLKDQKEGYDNHAWSLALNYKY